MSDTARDVFNKLRRAETRSAVLREERDVALEQVRQLRVELGRAAEAAEARRNGE